MNGIIRKWQKKYGYTPETSEIIYAYQCGELILTDAEENAILKLLNG